jgi:hypothetical protein
MLAPTCRELCFPQIWLTHANDLELIMERNDGLKLDTRNNPSHFRC